MKTFTFFFVKEKSNQSVLNVIFKLSLLALHHDDVSLPS